MAHIDAALIPILISPATVTGTAQQGQTLTASNGNWGDEPDSYAYQWQHCDAAGANCTDVAGATAATYAVTAADVGFTLHVDVTATNRFGSAKSPVGADGRRARSRSPRASIRSRKHTGAPWFRRGRLSG